MKFNYSETSKTFKFTNDEMVDNIRKTLIRLPSLSYVIIWLLYAGLALMYAIAFTNAFEKTGANISILVGTLAVSLIAMIVMSVILHKKAVCLNYFYRSDRNEDLRLYLSRYLSKQDTSNKGVQKILNNDNIRKEIVKQYDAQAHYLDIPHRRLNDDKVTYYQGQLDFTLFAKYIKENYQDIIDKYNPNNTEESSEKKVKKEAKTV